VKNKLVQGHRQAKLCLAACGETGVIEAVGILWSDQGKPERIVEFLRVLGKQPLFPVLKFQLIQITKGPPGLPQSPVIGRRQCEFVEVSEDVRPETAEPR